jgi:hypothetical protein
MIETLNQDTRARWFLAGNHCVRTGRSLNG